MEIKIVKIDRSSCGVELGIFLDGEMHTSASAETLLDKTYESLCLLMANTAYSMLAEQDPRHITRDAPVTRAIELLRRVWNADCDGTDLPSDLIKEISAVLKTPVRG